MPKTNKLYAIVLIALLSAIMLTGCNRNKNNVPKPKGYFRIDLPKKNYIRYEGECPYHFDYPEYAIIFPGKEENPCWLNIHFPLQDATIYLTYKSVDGDLHSMTEDSRELAYKHTTKAEAINETSFTNEENDVYGIMYDLRGNVASALQFHLTDSTNHFIRGSLYFNTKPNKDSVAPVLRFIRKDVVQLIESTEWK
ncbi:MAG: gliding motility lipoprotein GldD [Bacteroidota bacterium]